MFLPLTPDALHLLGVCLLPQMLQEDVSPLGVLGMCTVEAIIFFPQNDHSKILQSFC